MACDFNAQAMETYSMNFTHTHTVIEDIRNISYDYVHAVTGLNKGELDILDGSPPCTPFSTCGLREKGWGKIYKHTGESKAQRSDDLFFEYIRLIGELMPKTFIAENVSGLIKGKAKKYYHEIIRLMKALGYNISSFLLNAKYFEVPQSRQRVIITGIRKDIIPKSATLKLHKPITFIQAVQDLVNTQEELDYARRLINSDKHIFAVYTRQGQQLSKVNPKGNWFNYSRARLDQPIPTIVAHSNMIMHPIENRWLTLSELKRCASFPDSFKFKTIGDGNVRIGNSVPPNLIKHVATYLIKKAGLS